MVLNWFYIILLQFNVIIFNCPFEYLLGLLFILFVFPVRISEIRNSPRVSRKYISDYVISLSLSFPYNLSINYYC